MMLKIDRKFGKYFWLPTWYSCKLIDRAVLVKIGKIVLKIVDVVEGIIVEDVSIFNNKIKNFKFMKIGIIKFLKMSGKSGIFYWDDANISGMDLFRQKN